MALPLLTLNSTLTTANHCNQPTTANNIHTSTKRPIAVVRNDIYHCNYSAPFQPPSSTEPSRIGSSGKEWENGIGEREDVNMVLRLSINYANSNLGCRNPVSKIPTHAWSFVQVYCWR